MTNSFSEDIRKYNDSRRLSGYMPSMTVPEAVNDRMLCLIRYLLALTVLIIGAVLHISPGNLVEYAVAVLIFNFCYSAVLLVLAQNGKFPVPVKFIPWIDALLYLPLIIVTGGTGSIFFILFFFPVLAAAFRSGFRSGLWLTLACLFLFLTTGLTTAWLGEPFDLNRFLIRPIYFALFGYLISYWGGQEIKSKNHLILLKEVNRLSNPRFGIDRTLNDILSRLQNFYQAESCILITCRSGDEPGKDRYHWREVSRQNSKNYLPGEDTDAAAPLITLPARTAIISRKTRFSFAGKTSCRIYDETGGYEMRLEAKVCETLIDLLGSRCFLTVPVVKYSEVIGRLYLISPASCFDHSEVAFVAQLLEQALVVAENVELLDRLASGAAKNQRRKISRDLHDSTIQPYIGLKLGLEAVKMKCAAGLPVAAEIEKLIAMTEETVLELRGFVKNLNVEDVETREAELIGALRRQAAKFHKFYDINMTVRAAADLCLNDRLAAETYQIVSEGLSNIRRHTTAKSGSISIYQNDENLFVEIENQTDAPQVQSEFVPKSLAGRAAALGGSLRVETSDGRTKISIIIPL